MIRQVIFVIPKLKGANDAVSQLRRYHSKQQEQIQSDEDKVKARKRFAERQRQATQSQQTLHDLNEGLNALAQSLGKQKAGYDFQEWFYELLDFSEISNRNRTSTSAARSTDRSPCLERPTSWN